MHLLEKIVAAKGAELARKKKLLPHAVLRQLSAAREQAPRSFKRALMSAPLVIIAEVKRASPRKGVLRPDIMPLDWDPLFLARAYEEGGARALSILTDERFFWGSPDNLVNCKAATSLPVLRKEFILDPYQVDESYWLGADAILLMASILDPALLRDLAAQAAALGLDILIEVHADTELEQALSENNAVIGINHRDLKTMRMDMQRALRLAPRIPQDRVVVAESGLRSAADLKPLREAGIRSFLIGESLAAAPDPARALREFLV